MIKDNLQYFIDFCKQPNSYGEKITLVGATKTLSVDVINEAISLGLKDIGENYPQEFRDKFNEVLPVNYHFFGRLQKNKVKYLIGKACLIQSVDSFSLAEEIARQSEKANLTTPILLELNLGEENKGGIPIDTIDSEYKKIAKLDAIKIKGLMAVLPNSDDFEYIKSLCLRVRKKYDIIKDNSDFNILSMGMSHDYKLAVECGSNMIRIGSKIFGERIYKEKK